MNAHNNLWGEHVKDLMEHLMKEHGKYQKFGCLPDACSNFPCQLGSLASISFSERMISTVDLLVYACRIHLDHNNIEKMVFCA